MVPSTPSIYLVVAIAISAAGFGVALCYLFCRSLKTQRVSHLTSGTREHNYPHGVRQQAEGMDRWSLENYYRPMLTLLDPMELEAAKQLPNISAREWGGFRRARIQAFRFYLQDLKLDFYRLEFKLRYLLLARPASQHQLLSRLNQLKLSFTVRCWALEARLLLFSLGVGTVDASGLLQELNWLDAAMEAPSATTRQMSTV